MSSFPPPRSVFFIFTFSTIVKINIISSGGTFREINRLGYKCQEISKFTKFNEMLGGRVKTLHPKIHAGILNNRSNKKHNKEMSKKRFVNIDLVIVNFYPFQQTIEKNGSLKKIIENIVSTDLFDVVSNPEFLREGSAVNDFMRPDRVVIGTENKKSENIMRELYRPLNLNETPIILTSIESSEIIKYASNSFLATKIAFINEVADLCEKVEANVQDVAKAMGLDNRIGSKFLNVSPGYGGSCFPKDVRAFSENAKKYGVDLSIIRTVDHSNTQRIMKIASQIIDKLGNNLDKKEVCLLGLSFKPNTDDIRDSAAIIIARELMNKGAKINCFDPKAMENAKKIIPELNCCISSYEACNNASAIIIATEWNEFRALNLKKIKESVSQPVIFDLRNIYNKEYVINLGIEYHGIGK